MTWTQKIKDKPAKSKQVGRNSKRRPRRTADFNPVRCEGNRLLFPFQLGWKNSIFARIRIFTVTQKLKHKKVILDFSRVKRAYPDGIVPIIAETSRLTAMGYKFEALPPRDVSVRSLFIRNRWLYYINPEDVERAPAEGFSSLPLQKFSSDEELNDMVNKVVEVCLQQLVFADGVPQALEWSVNEIAGNILIHSKAHEGWVQVMTYRDNHILKLIVCDTGIGIPASMKQRFKFNQDRDGLALAIKKGVTSNPEYGQGNGLAGALSIAQNSDGHFAITSGSGRVSVNKGKVDIESTFPPYNGTCVFMQFSTDKEVDLPRALWGYNPINYMETKFEDDRGDLVFNLREYASSFGNRITGERIRNLILNLLRQNPGRVVKVIMHDIGIISSSFADELFGKLFVELGPIDFATFVKTEGINPLCKSIVDLSISQRVAQTTLGVTPVRDGYLP